MGVSSLGVDENKNAVKYLKVFLPVGAHLSDWLYQATLTRARLEKWLNIYNTSIQKKGKTFSRPWYFGSLLHFFIKIKM